MRVEGATSPQRFLTSRIFRSRQRRSVAICPRAGSRGAPAKSVGSFGVRRSPPVGAPVFSPRASDRARSRRFGRALVGSAATLNHHASTRAPPCGGAYRPASCLRQPSAIFPLQPPRSHFLFSQAHGLTSALRRQRLVPCSPQSPRVPLGRPVVPSLSKPLWRVHSFIFPPSSARRGPTAE